MFFEKEKKSSSREERMHHFLVCCSEHQAAGFAQKMPRRNFANGKEGGGKNVCSFFIEIWESSMSAKNIYGEQRMQKRPLFVLHFLSGVLLPKKYVTTNFYSFRLCVPPFVFLPTKQKKEREKKKFYDLFCGRSLSGIFLAALTCFLAPVLLR